MELTVLTPDKKIFEGKISRVSVPGTDGEFEVLDNHAPIVSSLGEGNVLINTVDNKTPISLIIQNGFIEVLDNKISLLVQEQ